MALPTKFRVACAALVFGGILIIIGLLVFWLPDYRSNTLLEVAECKAYLIKYGYLEDDGNSSNTNEINAMKVFQKEAGLDITGVLTEATKKKMKLPRCGMAFTQRLETEQSRWQKKNLTYSIKKYPNSSLSTEDVDTEITRAFNVWSSYTDLTFRALYGHHYKVDIEIRFEVDDHGDGPMNSFDGPGGILAHAFYPQNGRTHFDDSEAWTIYSDEGTNLFQVAAHEFGHALGLAHSAVEGALMAPFYTGYQEEFQLHNDDITRIQELYGKKNLCRDVAVDTIFTDLSGATYVIKGSQYWEWDGNGVPRDVKVKWAGLPDSLNAAFSHREIAKTYFFSGANVWRYQGNKLDQGYPKKIAERFPGIPNNVDTAFVWPRNNQIYFFKGINFWMYDYKKFPPVSSEFPQKISDSWWHGLPDAPDAAFTRGFNSYFAKGSRYAQFTDNNNGQCFASQSKNIGEMIGCSPAQLPVSLPSPFEGERMQSQRQRLEPPQWTTTRTKKCEGHDDCIMP